MPAASPRLSFWSRPDLGLELVAASGVDIRYATHIHVATFTLGLVRRGTLCLRLAEEELRPGDGDVFVVRPYQPHSFAAEGRYGLVTLSVDKSLPGSKNRLREAVRHVRRLDAKGVASAREAGLLARELAALPVWNGQCGDDDLEKLKILIETAPDRPFSIADMACLAGLDEFLLIRRFRRRYGLTPHRFLLQNRLRLARRELGGTLPLTRVALRAGFYDQSHFNREFRGAAALSPKQYRAARRGLNTGQA